MPNDRSSVEALLPQWRTQPNRATYLDIFKNGRRVDEINLAMREYTVFGRSPDFADVILEHQSISRKHAACFFKGDSFFIMDLGSGHGTTIGDNEVAKMCAVEIKDGHEITFGKSSRTYVVRIEGPLNKVARPPVPSFLSGESGPSISNYAAEVAAPSPKRDHKKEEVVAAQPAAPTQPEEKKAVDVTEDREAARLARQREIAAFAAEMMSSAPKVKSHPKGLFATLDIKSFKTVVGEAGDGTEDGPAVEEQDEEDIENFEKDADADDADGFEDDHKNDSGGDDHVVGATKAAAEDKTSEITAPVDSVEAFCNSRKVPVSHQVHLYYR